LNRRSFVKLTGLAATTLTLSKCTPGLAPTNTNQKPLVIATWANRKAIDAAWQILAKDGSALDAVEPGARVPEADPDDRSVGYGGHPDRTGRMTLDASIMDGQGNCGAVGMLEDIKHPVSLARIVMEKTPHVMIVGDGGKKLALEHGFVEENILSDQSKVDYERWLETHEEVTPFDHPTESHDSIGILAIDSSNKLAGACSTSGMSYKLRGRLGDAPVIGAGLFVDDEVGAATATGNGEEMIRIAGAHLIVERMRMGDTPQQACEEAIRRVIKKHGDAAKEIMVCFLAINNAGEIGAWSTTPGFEYTIKSADTETEVVKVGFAFQEKAAS
jgi:isoaspartyl peptidase/L-asparaginase-like protein (Ntn-hydrolase superfamily)